MGKAGLSGQNFWGEAVFRTENVAATHGWGFLLALLRSGLQFYHVSPAQLTPRCDLASACDSSVHRRVHRDLCRRQGATRVKVVWGSSTRDCLQRWGKLGQQRQSSARRRLCGEGCSKKNELHQGQPKAAPQEESQQNECPSAGVCQPVFLTCVTSVHFPGVISLPIP